MYISYSKWSSPASVVSSWCKNDWFHLLEPQDQVIVSEELSFQEPRLSNGGLHCYHGDKLNLDDDHDKEDDEEEMYERTTRNLVNQGVWFCEHGNGVHEDPSNYERRMQQNLRISSEFRYLWRRGNIEKGQFCFRYL